MLIYFVSLLFVFLGLSLLNFEYFYSSSRFSTISFWFVNFVNALFSVEFGNILIVSLFYFILIGNILGNLPASVSPNMLYCITLTSGLLFWLALLCCVGATKFEPFVAHLLPYGAPMTLSLFLPLVELFSQIIRPFTLIVRLSTNLSAGHIIMYMFSYFTLSSAVLAPFVDMVIIFLLILEFCICCLQAYIFLTLLSLYFSESV